MRQFELSQDIATEPSRAWHALVRLDDWPQWNGLMPSGRGELRVGAVLDLRMRRVDGTLRPHRPTVVAIDPPVRVVLAADFGHRVLVSMEHALSIEAVAPGRSRLRQTWTVTGLAVPLLWPTLVGIMTRFTQLGDDLTARLSALDALSPPSQGTGVNHAF